MTKDFFTTFEVGDLCQVYHTSVINWINKGQLKAHTTPGGHRRIQKDDLHRFMKEFNIPIPESLINPKKSILAVDDDQAILTVVEKGFAPYKAKAQLQTTTNGVEALVLIGKRLPDLIILDVVMPEMDGIQVCRTLKSREETEKIKIITVTGQDLSEDEETFLTNNVDSVFKKPFSILKLIEKSCALLGIEEKPHEAK